MKRAVTVTVNGDEVCALVEPRTLLVDFLREKDQLTGTHAGCHQGWCGACTVLVDGGSTRSCLTLAVQLDGAEVRTVALRGRRRGPAGAGAAPGRVCRPTPPVARHPDLQCGHHRGRRRA